MNNSLADGKLPPLPPFQDLDAAHDSAPPPPPKNADSGSQLLSEQSEPGLSAPASPIRPLSPPSPSAESRQKKSNPLTDLIDTEKTYVDQLTGIIRKVAAAWSRSNLPPPDLDTMFRSIEAVYKANRSLHSKLKEIGANPSSPKALGDLLMRWIDDLEAPYTTYCTKFISGFDEWTPVQSNARLANILSNFSASNPPPSSSNSSPSYSDPSVWTLDALFLLPKARLKYYKKLYNRLLKSTTPGRSDHKLLLGALDKLDNLLATLGKRQEVKPGAPSVDAPPVETEDEVVIDLRTQSGVDQDSRPDSTRLSQPNNAPGSESGSARGSGLSSSASGRLSQDTVSTNLSRGSTSTMSTPISDLERRLSTQRTLDIFTMKPKAVRLQMSPPSLVFTRELRFSMDVVVSLSSRATGIETVHPRGHVFLLSDLFLVCERMSNEERAQGGPDGPDMWLCYPPLAGKVLRVSEVPGQDTLLQVAIMRKETLILQTESVQARNFMLSEFKECIEFAGSIGPVSKDIPPPLPSLPGMLRSPSAPIPNSTSIRPGSGVTSPASNRSQSPPSMNSGEVRRDLTTSVSNPGSRMHSPEADMRMAPPFPTRGVSSGPPTSFNPGQILPTRNASFATQEAPQRYSPADFQNAPHHQASRNQHSFSPQSQSQSPHGSWRPPSGSNSVLSPTESSHSIRQTPSTRSLSSQYERQQPDYAPPLPSLPGEYNNPNQGSAGMPRYDQPPLAAPQPRMLLPSAQFNSRASSMAEESFADPSPPNSPVQETIPFAGPVTSSIAATMKCKVFLKQHHAQWKSLGAAKLKLYREDPTNVKQLVVEADNKASAVLISTIVLTDGVERVGKTGVAVELSDHGARTGIVYMIQLRTEKSAGGLFDTLLAGSDRVRG